MFRTISESNSLQPFVFQRVAIQAFIVWLVNVSFFSLSWSRSPVICQLTKLLDSANCPNSSTNMILLGARESELASTHLTNEQLLTTTTGSFAEHSRMCRRSIKIDVLVTEMACRLCLSFAPAESSFFIYDDLHPLEQQILSNCQLRVSLLYYIDSLIS